MASTDIKDYYRRAWGLKDRVPFKYGGTWADWKVNYEDQMSFEEYLQDDVIVKKIQAIDKRAEGGRIGRADGPPGKLVIQKPAMTLAKQKISASPLKEDYLGQLIDKRKVRTSTLNDAFEIRNIIVKNKGHVANIEELGRLSGIVGSGGKPDHRKTQLAFDLAMDSFEELKGFK